MNLDQRTEAQAISETYSPVDAEAFREGYRNAERFARQSGFFDPNTPDEGDRAFQAGIIACICQLKDQ